MTPLTELWLPIVLSAVAVFLASSVIHMVLPWHRDDYPRLPNEDQVLDALRPLAIPPGDYMMPRAGSPEAMRSPEFLKKMEQGPVMMMTVRPNGAWGMGKNLAMWFVYSLVVGVFAGYLTGRAVIPGAEYLTVFRFAGTVAFAGYSLAIWQMSIWYSRAWSLTLKTTVDGLVYALLTAGVFGWLWPR